MSTPLEAKKNINKLKELINKLLTGSSEQTQKHKKEDESSLNLI